MGDTLVFATPSVPTSSGRDIFAGQTIAHLGVPIALAAAASLDKSEMTAPSNTKQSPVRERRATEFSPHPRPPSDPAQLKLDSVFQKPSIILRRLPRNTGQEGIRNLLLFAKDLVAVKLIDSLPEDAGYATAIAQFQTLASAREAKESLDGKPNATQEAHLIVELPSHGSPTDTAARLASRRSTIDANVQRSAGPHSAVPGQEQRSRFSAAFEKISPPLITPSQTNGDFPAPESNAHLQSLFSPKSPMGNDVHDNQRNFGKSMINNDAADDETDGLIRNPLAYVRDGRPSTNGHRPSMPQIPTAQFSSFSLNDTGPLSPPHSGLVSPSAGPQHGAPFSQKLSHNNSYNSSMNPSPAGRTSYPPANPADQNPPCNTLYVGNLPNNTSEDELKRLFSQQRGYKRLCFRTKQNGPMCFVEFESITLATQALHHLYGKMLSNSVKGGIRLSFSKNPLGVRNGQAGVSPNALSPHGGYSPGGFGGGDMISPPPGFSSASNGAGPPGLPQGARSGNGAPSFGRSPTGGDAMSPVYQAHQYSMSGAPFASQLRMPPAALHQSQEMPPTTAGFVPPFYDSAAR